METLNSLYDDPGLRDRTYNYALRHGIESQEMLTVTDDEVANAIAESLAPRIADKTVIEIGGGIGLLALHMGFWAKRVFCIEANPIWAASFHGLPAHHETEERVLLIRISR